MILQALYQLAEEEGLVQDLDFEWKPVSYLINLDADGRFLGFTDTHYTPPQEGKRKPKPVARKMKVPRCPTRTSGDAALFLFDKAEYVLGRDPDGKRDAEKLEIRAGLFREEVRACVDATDDAGARAALAFLEKAASEVQLPEDCAGNDLFAFVVAPDEDRLLTDRPAIRDHWKERRSQEEGKRGICLVRGQEGPLADLFPGIKKVPGGSTSGVALVSFNKAAFCSYGWKNNENAPVSRDAAEACATALNRLLDPAYPDPSGSGQSLSKRHLRLSGDTVVAYWAPNEAGTDFCDVFDGLFSANADEVGELYKSVWRGKAPDISDPSAFYALTLTGTQGRAVVRDWFETTVADVMANLAQYFADIDIVRNTPKPKKGELPPQFPLSLLLESLAVQGKRDEIPSPLAAQFVRSALSGAPLPFSILQRALERMRAEIGKTEWLDLARRDGRAALIKAVLNRRFNMEVKHEMDPTNKNTGYLLGRLMATIERMQQAALGNVNATVVDRYFAGASATPIAVFPRLLKNMRNHAAKAKDEAKSRGTAIWLERLCDEISSEITGFPPHLDLAQQGLFVLGYHHQRHDLWKKKDPEEAAPAE